ncbi:IclR family transcriptional regulator [Futiania mangrovi]|uniref:IclR family transcriptional regulator n=1 Tax=Futiania mangrovi TaxID=2959716 RepID=A0A9J6PG16_9PROT|nr:IclR family transcriptional regulator [Futiania mangrovii]MCP1336768.1 IclR family transcriptional regulator [Futiania mangrovii]
MPTHSDTTGRRDGPAALARTFDILRALADEPQGLTLTEIAARTGTAKSTLSSVLRGLADLGLLERRAGLYGLGVEAYALASTIVAGRALRRIARPYLERLVDRCGETTLLAVLTTGRQHFTYIDSIESPKSIRYSVPVGATRPLYPTACGRLFLAYAPERDLDRYLEDERLSARTDRTIVEREQLRDRLREIRATGVSVTMGDYDMDVGGFAAPVFGADGAVEAAIVVAAPLARAEREPAFFVRAVTQEAAELSRVMGYREALAAAHTNAHAAG